jgi:hypothetical protein
VASNGMPRSVISSPNWLIVWPLHSFMKSRWRHSDGRWGAAVASSDSDGCPGSGISSDMRDG